MIYIIDIYYDILLGDYHNIIFRFYNNNKRCACSCSLLNLFRVMYSQPADVCFDTAKRLKRQLVHLVRS